MCIFTGTVHSVGSTKIFARVEGQKQVIVYEMYLDTGAPVAMVLPLPIADQARTSGLEFVDLSPYPDFFEDLAACFPQSRGPVALSAARFADDFLEVQTVGAFEASFVPSIADFKRLDPRFRLDDSVWQNFSGYQDYGFAVFKLRAGQRQVHPMAFWFETRDPNSLFFPTVHLHDGHFERFADFDHVLFAQGELEASLGLERGNKSPRAVMQLDSAAGLIHPEHLPTRLNMVGSFENVDIRLALAVPSRGDSQV